MVLNEELLEKKLVKKNDFCGVRKSRDGLLKIIGEK